MEPPDDEWLEIQSEGRCIARVLKRVATNWHGEIQAEGCPEHFDLGFLQWLWRLPRDGRQRPDEAPRSHQGALEVVELLTRVQVRRYLESLRYGVGGG
jgi:hypothetical protein